MDVGQDEKVSQCNTASALENNTTWKMFFQAMLYGFPKKELYITSCAIYRNS